MFVCISDRFAQVFRRAFHASAVVVAFTMYNFAYNIASRIKVNEMGMLLNVQGWNVVSIKNSLGAFQAEILVKAKFSHIKVSDWRRFCKISKERNLNCPHIYEILADQPATLLSSDKGMIETI